MKVASQTSANSEYTVVLGLGTTGVSCARYLYQRGLRFAVVDTRAQPPGLAELRREMPDVEVFVGDYPDAIFSGAAEVVVSPGIAMDAGIVLQALTAGAAVVGDIDLFVREAQAPIIGITGSNAKSTVTELVGQMARQANLDVGVGGNLGTPALELLAPERELYVLELSSFQLERAQQLGLEVATVLNVSADHLDRHATMANYRSAKHRIFSGCKKAVVNRDDASTIPLLSADVEVVGWCMAAPQAGDFGIGESEGVPYFYYGTKPLMPLADLRLVGRHNIANALAALALGYSVGLALPAMLATLKTFGGLPHRCEELAEINGVRYINDSKGTNVGATEAALNGLGGERNVVLIAGGQGKGADFSQLQQAVARHCKLLLLMGEDAAQIEQALASAAPVRIVASLAEAVSAAAQCADSGDVVLLSPACASFDMFTGYAQRGDVFAAQVKALEGCQ